MTCRSLYRLEAAGRLDCLIIGVAKDDWSDHQLRMSMRRAPTTAHESIDDTVFGRLAGRVSFLQGDFADHASYEALAQRLKGCSRPLFYLETAPSLFAPVVAALSQAGLTDHAAVMIEKPFGRDLSTARQLNAALQVVFDEEQILRIDHFLGKQPVLDVNFLCFANSVLEPVWDHEHVAAVQVMMAEDSGWRTGAPFTTRWERYGMWSRTTCFKCWLSSPWSHQAARDRGHCGTGRSMSSGRWQISNLPTACGASSRATGRSLV